MSVCPRRSCTVRMSMRLPETIFHAETRRRVLIRRKRRERRAVANRLIISGRSLCVFVSLRETRGQFAGFVVGIFFPVFYHEFFEGHEWGNRAPSPKVGKTVVQTAEPGYGFEGGNHLSKTKWCAVQWDGSGADAGTGLPVRASGPQRSPKLA
jgi:hypothetical protein